MTDIILKLGSGKNDESYDWGTDALKIGVNIIAPHFKCLFKAFLIHGHISQLFLCCALLPIVKNAKNSKFASENYRLIAISSLILKLLDYIILALYGDNFSSENLQFGFQKNSSTSMCTWMFLETVNYFTNRGSPVYACLLDLTKAFDTVKHDKLFRKLIHKVPPLFLRLVIYSYVYQSVYVKWSGINSESFSIRNGVRQGAVASPTFLNIYLDELFTILKNSGLGCVINDLYYGLFGYADDCSLLSPSCEALQRMLNICQKYFEDHGIRISVSDIVEKSKTKCLAFNSKIIPASIMLYDKPLPWADSYKHLGHLINTDEHMSHDLFTKRAEFISKAHSLRQELGFQDPLVFMKLVMVYLSSMYGSNLWDLFGEAASKLYISWNVLIKTTYNLPYATHRYILQDLVPFPHIRLCLLRRFVKFYSQLQMCPKIEVRNLFHLQKHDTRSTFGRNCFKLIRECNVTHFDDININNIKMPIKTPETEGWRLPFVQELLSIKRGNHAVDINSTEINNYMNFICTS